VAKPPAGSSLLFGALADSGRIKQRKNGSYQMVLKGIDEIDWFTDRPDRFEGLWKPQKLIRKWDSFFASSEPNAQASFKAGEERELITFEMFKPRYNAQNQEFSFKLDAGIINKREDDLVAKLKGKALKEATLFIDDAVIPEDPMDIRWGSYPMNSIRPTQDEVTYWEDVAERWGEEDLMNWNPDGGGMIFLQASLYEKIQEEIDSSNTFDNVTVGKLVYMPDILYSRIQNQLDPDSLLKGNLIGNTTIGTNFYAETGYTDSSYPSICDFGDGADLRWGAYPMGSIRPTQDEIVYWKDVAKKWDEDELADWNPNGGGMVFMKSSLYDKIQGEIDSSNIFDDVTVGSLVYLPDTLYSRIQDQIALNSAYKGDLIGVSEIGTNFFAETGYIQSSYPSS